MSAIRAAWFPLRSGVPIRYDDAPIRTLVMMAEGSGGLLPGKGRALARPGSVLKAKRAYAWSSPIEGSERRKFYAVLEVPPITSAQDAVRAAIVADHRTQEVRHGD